MPNLSIIPARALKDPSITDSDIRVLCAIGLHTDRTGAGCWASSRTLSEEAGVGRSTFFAATGRLQAAGLIRRSSGQESGRTSTYQVLLDVSELHETPGPESRQRDWGESSQRDTPRPASQIGESGQPDTPTINDPFNDPLNESSPGILAFLQPGYEADFGELEERITKAGGSLTSWRMELRAALDGMHSPIRTPLEISQAIRDFNASGAEISLRLFRGYLRGNGRGYDESPSEAKREPGAYTSRVKGGTLAAAELIRKVRMAATVHNPYSGAVGFPADWKDAFTTVERRLIDAFTPRRFLDDKNDGTLTSQLRQAMEEASE